MGLVQPFLLWKGLGKMKKLNIILIIAGIMVFLFGVHHVHATDVGGVIDTDTMVFTATGIKGDFDFDGDCDGENLRIFAESYGMYVGQ